MLYVLGFLFDPSGQKVALIEKQKPAWQKGRLNGIGGKVEQYETHDEAIIREFEEETGVRITNWKMVGHMGDIPAWEALVYTTTSPLINEVRTTTDEKVIVLNCTEAISLHSSRTISNVPYLVAICRDFLFNPNGPTRVDIKYKRPD